MRLQSRTIWVSVVSKAGGIDISFNAIELPASVVADKGMQGVPLTEIPIESFMHPITTYTRSHFSTGRAAARRMTLAKKPGVILMHTPRRRASACRSSAGWRPRGPHWKRFAALSRRNLQLTAFARYAYGRTSLPETRTIEIVFGIHAKVLGIEREAFQHFMESTSHTRRSTRLPKN